MRKAVVDLLVEDEDWLRELPELLAIAEQATYMAVTQAALNPQQYSVSLLACDDTRIAALNASFRTKNTATNVLSWPSLNLAPSVPGEVPAAPPQAANRDPVLLGDVAIALQTCLREAAAAQKPLKNHVTHLILHGCLHLLGYDHKTDKDAELMEGIESRALAAIGLPDPYVEGGAASPHADS